jgi:cyclase
MSTSTQTGLTDVGNGIYAYVQPNTPTSWGWSNAGLIESAGSTLLVDTLYTLRQTQDMLDAMRAVTPAARGIDVLVNTHADPDHTFGNQLIEGAQIIATAAAAADMVVNLTPDQVRGMMANTAALGDAGKFLERVCAPLDFSGIELVLPTETFTGRKTLQVGEKAVDLIDLGPAHTRGDLIVHVPQDRVVFTGDLLFAGSHAVLWSGPVSNWTSALDAIIALDPEVVVSGHGPLSDAAGLREYRDYLHHLEAEATALHAKGVGVTEAARAIDLSAYDHWIDEERVVLCVDTIYKGLEGDTSAPDYARLFGEMERFSHGH